MTAATSTSVPPCTVMVVDDDDDIRGSLADILSDEGYAVRAAANGREALADLRSGKTRPSVILIDLMMPVMNGYELRTELLRDPELSSIPVVVVSARGTIDQRQVAPAEILRKPVELGVLLETIERHR